MTDQLPTIQIKNQKYVQVKDRILYFNETYPNGSINTDLVSPIDSKTIVVKAMVIPDVKMPERFFSDYSQAVIGQGMVNQTAAMENASTSAVGRALGFMGIGIIESVASADEVHKAINSQPNDNEVVREVNPDECEHEEFWINEVKKEDSPNKGKKFKSCKSCRAFLGFIKNEE